MSGDELLAEQRRYYAARAPEYDDWWFRRGRFALDPEAEARWNADVGEVEAALARFGAHGDVLEIAAGTGLWTRHLAHTAERVVAVDANAETLAFAGWTAVTFLITDTHRFAISAVTLVMALLVAQTRIEAGVHSSLEVLYGGVLGATVTLVCFQVFS